MQLAESPTLSCASYIEIHKYWLALKATKEQANFGMLRFLEQQGVDISSDWKTGCQTDTAFRKYFMDQGLDFGLLTTISQNVKDTVSGSIEFAGDLLDFAKNNKGKVIGIVLTGAAIYFAGPIILRTLPKLLSQGKAKIKKIQGSVKGQTAIRITAVGLTLVTLTGLYYYINNKIKQAASKVNNPIYDSAGNFRLPANINQDLANVKYRATAKVIHDELDQFWGVDDDDRLKVNSIIMKNIKNKDDYSKVKEQFLTLGKGDMFKYINREYPNKRTLAKWISLDNYMKKINVWK